ncbi:MAG: sugar phosphate nucleotidyltransferase [Candidatus Nanoarchaeia archaeon]|nr:sugar phosphate nucleotidyltransferase [Candidatus Nanoarchaeia archaeon]MDD5358141.1 sugar phosphate nucleotidyltransferase [Candidatus Nanoarchaeia archaeon]MDD5589328.1 sugar phosphate nucleotidyltransferase [Candidatus Nanoarchaeia archaeon]
MKAVIIAGGKGVRLEELTKEKNKAMLRIYDKSLLEYNLDRAVEAKVKEIILVLCYMPQEIIKRIGKRYKGISVTYVIEKEGKGIVNAIENAKEMIGKSDFILMLGDEVMIDTDVKGMITKFRREDLFAVCGIVYENDKSSIKRTYSVMTSKEGRIFRLVEKPRFPISNLKGTGYCVFKNEILDYVDKTPINAYRNQKELVDMIQCAVDDGKEVKIHRIARDYTNVNTYEELNIAKEMIKKSKPKVLIIHNQMKYFGGGELLIVELANELTKRGIKNDILALSSSKDVEEQLLNTEVIIPENNIYLNPPGYKNMSDILNAIKVFRKKLNEIIDNYDVINFHDFPVTWTLWPKKKPSVWFMNLPPNLYSKPKAGLVLKTLNKLRIWLDRFIVRGSIDVITVAESLNQIRAKKRYGKNARLIDFGIDYEFFSKGKAANAIKKFNLKNKFVIIQSGILCDVKNQLESIKAVEKVKDAIPNILLVLTGKEDAEYKKKLGAYIKEKKLEKFVLFLGFLKTREELRDLYKSADIGLFPIKKQGGVLAPIEVLCAGIPIIVSTEIETASLIKKNNLGTITTEYDKEILNIYREKERYKKIARGGALFVKNNLSWKAFAEKMVEAYMFSWKKREHN